MKVKYFLWLLVILPIIGSCSTVDGESGKTPYDETKDMVIDILKTDDGKKALKEVLADDELKQELVLDSAIVAQSIEGTLLSEKGKEFWKKSFEDGEFVKVYAQSMEDENKNLLKKLMADPEYRAMLIEVLQDPALEKEIVDLLKSQEYRQYLKDLITETLESPLYQAKIEEILLKAANEKTDSGESEENGGA
ncbi:spore germination lipoprotein GerD [Fervidibacillus halotolerans]|uniref:Spore germination lipoprotein GerD n=1 Tax=Fervidibacillus halotolerans TaxID=2980027 RepID=A0A9E8LZ34_9BACI|nr:spore germination lipoprotein GerD [Fervidibacillus halotolerans]WAA12443.1 spore germination lipoprotein GerD [Fervidibacillus halotolerans]